MAVNLLVQVAESMSLTLDQVREGARLLAGNTAKQDHQTVTAETRITLGQYRQAVHWACQQIRSTALIKPCNQGSCGTPETAI